ncbi:MAG: VWA domain-containing protein [Chitinophagales bacterium]|nr:VWA domain-containing protein [Chitinophagales bacterium]
MKYLFILFFAIPLNAQRVDHEKPRILFILDASYSMNRKWGQEQMWEIAKRTLAEFATNLDKKYGAELALRVYGHKYDVSFNNCNDTELKVPMEFNNSERIKEVLSVLRYNGTTPIAYSMTFASLDFKELKGRNSIILITDGEESCSGNPCRVSQSLQEHGISIKPVVIGLDLSDFGIENLKCIGEVSNAKTPADLKQNLNKALDYILDKTTFQVHLLDGNRQATETDVMMRFTSPSGKVLGNFYHTMHNQNPDTLFLNDVIEFEASFLTIPPIKKKITLQKFVHNIVSIPAAQGHLTVKMDQPNGEEVKYIIRQNKKSIHSETVNRGTKLLVGKYQVDVLTTPLTHFEINIQDKKEEIIAIPNPGLLNLDKHSTMTGSIFIMEDRKMKKVYDINPNGLTEFISLQPGKYKIVYKPISYKSVYDTKEKGFEVVSGSKIILKL